MKTFPVLYGTREDGLVRDETNFFSVPWDFIQSHEQQAIRNHSQNLETLARRGGLDPREMLAVIENQHYRNYINRDLRETIFVLQKMIDEHISKNNV